MPIKIVMAWMHLYTAGSKTKMHRLVKKCFTISDFFESTPARVLANAFKAFDRPQSLHQKDGFLSGIDL